MNYFLNLPLPAQLFIIGLSITLLSSLIAALVTNYLQKKRTDSVRKLEDLKTAKKYAKPILESLISFGYRLREIFSSRHSFLLDTSASNKFNEYKLISTFYRFCAVLGWIRAYRKEHLYFDFHEDDFSKQVDNAISRFQSHIADGHFIELLRVKKLCKIFWDIDIEEKLEEKELEALGFKVETIIDKFLADIDNSFKYPIDLDETNQVVLLSKLLGIINQKIKREEISKRIIEEKVSSGTQAISILSTMIYRDWQNAIGDFMLKRLDSAPIRYEIKSFKEFDEYFRKDFSSEKNEWMLRAYRLFHNLDTDIDDQYDSRRIQLIKIYGGVIEVLEVIANIDNYLKEIISHHTNRFKEHLAELKLK